MCRGCSATKCVDADEGIEIECTQCDGKGCDECNQNGMFTIDGCPNAFCRSVVQTTNLCDLFHKGLPPVQGGALDQSNSFIEAARILGSEESIIKAES